MDVGAPFELPGDGADPEGAGASQSVGIVLVHGFTGTPYEVRYLGEQLARDGFTVRAPLLPGHGVSVKALDRTTWRDWVDAVEGAVDDLRGRCAQVAVVGQSLGGLLALYLGSQRPELAAVGSLAAPLWLPWFAARVAASTQGGLLRRVRVLPKLGGSDVRDRRVRAENPCYDAFPTRALGQLLAFMRIVDEALPRVTPPVLVLHGAQDHTAPVACAPRIADRARARRLRILPRSYHLIAVDVERDIVAAEVASFVRQAARERAAPASPPANP
ncbi:MAG TPA: alpha/beta fold hydrolase [Kofleriaceae bacterium]|nr:alpha/beta fold hydrolase [Kofleriaceae bacterium]